MYSALLLGIASFTLALFLTPLVRNYALRFGLVDRPDQHRKTHKRPIPRLGGVAILAATVGAYALVLLVRPSSSLIVREGLPFALRVLPAAVVIFGIGLLDDIFDINAWYKLAVQIVAATLAWKAGIRLDMINGHSFPSSVSFVLTIIWIVAYANAVNLIDGVDGLAAGAGLFATVTTLIAGLLHGNMALVFATVPLAGALFGFLRYNFNPASIFLGDCGSLTLGFVLGCYGIVWSEKSTTLLGMTAPVLALSVPLLDAAVAIARRFLRGQPIFRGDRHHIHHKLLSRGLTPRRVVLILYGFCGIAAAASLLMSETHKQYQGLVIVLVCFTAWLGLQHLGYDEFGTARRIALNGGFRRRLNAQMQLASFEQGLAACTTINECWEVLCEAYPHFGFSGVELQLDEVMRDGNLSGNCRVQIELPGQGYIHFLRSHEARDHDCSAILFIDTIAPAFSRKIEELQQDESGIPAFANAD